MPNLVSVPCTNPVCDNTSKVGQPLANAKVHCGDCDYHLDGEMTAGDYQRAILDLAIDKIDKGDNRRVSEIVSEAKKEIDTAILEGKR